MQTRLPNVLADERIRRLLGCVESPIHKACLSVLYACGLRISEAMTLEIGAIDNANLTLRIIGRGNKQRRVPLPQPGLGGWRRMCKTHHNSRWVFPHRAGTRPDTYHLPARTPAPD